MDGIIAVEHVKIHIQIGIVPEFQHSDRPIVSVIIDDDILPVLPLYPEALVEKGLRLRIPQIQNVLGSVASKANVAIPLFASKHDDDSPVGNGYRLRAAQNAAHPHAVAGKAQFL